MPLFQDSLFFSLHVFLDRKCESNIVQLYKGIGWDILKDILDTAAWDRVRPEGQTM